MANRDDRRILFKPRELEVLYEALMQYWNDLPVRHSKKRDEVRSLLDELGP